MSSWAHQKSARSQTAPGIVMSGAVTMRTHLDAHDEARAHMRATLAHLAAERRWLTYLEVLDRYKAMAPILADAR